jgi:acyl-homoserine lactone acylase PvdQ
MNGKVLTGIATVVVLIAVTIGVFIQYQPYGLVFKFPGITKTSTYQLLVEQQSRLTEAASRVEIIRDEWGTPRR